MSRRFSGKHLLHDQRAYALVCPETQEGGETEYFGFAPQLADLLLSWKGWWREMPAADFEEEMAAVSRVDKTFNPDLQRQRIRTADEINACIQALIDPHIDVWGYRLVEAQHRVVRAVCWTLDLDDLLPYYRLKGGPRLEIGPKLIELPDGGVRSNGPYYVAEQAIRTYLEAPPWACRWSNSEKQALFESYIKHDHNMRDRALVAQIRRQIDEDCD